MSNTGGERRRVPAALWILRGLTLLLFLGLLGGLYWRLVNAPRLAVEVIASGFDRPTSLLALDGRLLVSQQAGQILFTDNHELFLDLTAVVNDGDWEQGLFDMVLHPDYPADDRLFVSYSANDHDVVVASLSILDQRRQITAEVIRVPQPSPVHNGGRLEFGPDGLLYVGLGDGGPGEIADPDRQGQNAGTLLGTILRLDVDGASGYTVPDDNPFVAGGGAKEVWAYGVRNPWGLSFDAATQTVWIADVGHGAHEEVNRLALGSPAGWNLGWSQFEGMTCFRPAEGCDTSGIHMPLVDMAHADGNCSVIGGHVYRGTTIEWLVGRYVFSDFCSGKLHTVSAEGDGGDLRTEADLAGQPTAIEVGLDGELYVLTYDGDVLRVVDAPG